jgi:spore coat-associated protein N
MRGKLEEKKMGIKKKLGLGAASAALGLSLIGGGTFAYFNDTATINNAFAAGTLDLAVLAKESKPINFDLSNLKPGDSIERIFTLKNIGSLSINQVLMGANATDFVQGANEWVRNGNGDNSWEDYLSQFKVEMFMVDRETGAVQTTFTSTPDFNLLELVNGSLAGDIRTDFIVGNRINLTPDAARVGNPLGDTTRSGLPADPRDTDDVLIKITFKDSGDQNRFQGDKIQLHFNLEATQEGPAAVGQSDANGYLKSNEKASPSPVIINTPTTVTPVTDSVKENK